MKLYKIEGLGEGFDDLIVEASEDDVMDIFEIRRVINPDVMFGDRQLSFPVPPDALYINKQFLSEYDQSLRQYDSRNPFGKFLYETTYMRSPLQVCLVEHERAITVTVTESERVDAKHGGRSTFKTRYSQNFFGDLRTVRSVVQDAVKIGDLDDLILRLRELKEIELSEIGTSKE